MVSLMRKALRLCKSSESGQSMLEFAIAASVFFLLFSRRRLRILLFREGNLAECRAAGGRYAITGNCGPTRKLFQFGHTGGNRLPIILQTVSDFSFFLNPTVTVTCVSGTCPGYSGGRWQQRRWSRRCRANHCTYTWNPFVVTRFMPTMFPGGHYTLSVSSIFKNEPFAPPS